MKNFVRLLMDNHGHAVTAAERLIDLDFAAKAVAFCAVGDFLVFKLNSKLAACPFGIGKQLGP